MQSKSISSDSLDIIDASIFLLGYTLTSMVLSIFIPPFIYLIKISRYSINIKYSGVVIVFSTVFLITLKTALILEVSASNGITANNVINTLRTCDSYEYVDSRKNVIIRIDDIQKGAYQETTYRLIRESMQRKIPLVLGVIPQGISEDQKLVNLLKNYRCELEIALHGYTHDEELPEFKDASFDEADKKVKLGLKELSAIDKEIITFIPPQNIYSHETVDALNVNGIRILSDEGDGKYDYSTSTYNFEKNYLLPFDEVVKNCMKEFDDNSICIIMVHPQDFINPDGNIDYGKFVNYTKLLDSLRFQNANFLRFKDVVFSQLGI